MKKATDHLLYVPTATSVPPQNQQSLHQKAPLVSYSLRKDSPLCHISPNIFGLAFVFSVCASPLKNHFQLQSSVSNRATVWLFLLRLFLQNMITIPFTTGHWRERERERERVCACVCVRVCVRVCAWVRVLKRACAWMCVKKHVCVRERVFERDREKNLGCDDWVNWPPSGSWHSRHHVAETEKDRNRNRSGEDRDAAEILRQLIDFSAIWF